MRFVLLASSLVLGVAACGASPRHGSAALDAGEGEVADAGTSTTTAPDAGRASEAGPEPGCDKMDVLFVIDNSTSMHDEQANLAQNFPAFIDTLRSFRRGKVDYHIGVTTTAFPQSVLIFHTLGEAGALLQTKDMPQRWLESTDPMLATKFETLATVGTDGSSDEQPLKAARAALVDRVKDGTNRGFLRDDALLAIVVITDGDDQSTDGSSVLDQGNPIPASTFLSTFDDVKGGHRYGWTAAIIAGDQAPYCESSFGQAQYAAKLREFASEGGSQVRFSSICSGDLARGLSDALDTFLIACDNYVI